MKKSLQKIFAAAGTMVLAGLGLQTQASHYQGSELTYTCVAPNVYVVDLKLYRDCTGASAPTSATLQLKSTGCNNGRGVAMTKIGTNKIGNLYCPQLGPPMCSAAGPPNYEEVVFSATVTFSTQEAQCQDWLMSWTECCRPASANLSNATGASLYTVAYVNLGNQQTGPVNNSSPQFNSIVVPFVNFGKNIILSSNAIDIDGDSLVYTLQNPLDAPNTPVAYATINSQGGIIVNPQDSTRFVYMPNSSVTFTATYPMPSYSVDWNVPNPSAVTYFQFDPHTGSFAFNPTVYHPGATSVSGQNKYVVVVQVDEYRKINGSPVKIGSVRRDMFITVVDCGPNQNPTVAAPVANGQPLAPGTVMNLRPGTPLTFTFAAGDNNANDVLTLELNVAAVLPGAVFNKTSGNRPTGTITWTPTAAQVRDQNYYFTIAVQDNACPVKGQQVETFGVRVSNTGGVTGIKPAAAKEVFTAYPNPFSGKVSFRVKQTLPLQHILIFNVLGQQVDQIMVRGQLNTEQDITWLNASKFPAGQYIVRFSGAFDQSLKINKL